MDKDWKWISVEDALPATQEEVLTYSECNGIRAGALIVNKGENKVWLLLRSDKISIAVTHWMRMDLVPPPDCSRKENLTNEDRIRLMSGLELAQALTKDCMGMVQNILISYGVRPTATEICTISEQMQRRYSAALRSTVDSTTDLTFWGVILASEAYHTALDVIVDHGIEIDIEKIFGGLVED